MPLSIGHDRNILTIRLTGAQMLLLHQTLAAATFGIRLPGFASQVGIPRVKARAIISRFSDLMGSAERDANGLPMGTFEVEFDATDLRGLRNALELVMKDFGHEEFSTRTGFDLADGARMLDHLSAALIAPLNIEHPPGPVDRDQVAQGR